MTEPNYLTNPAPSLAVLRQQLKAALPAASSARAVTASGYKLLDELLPQQGWSAGVTELLLNQPASQELSLLMPAMRAIQAQGRWLAVVNPPAIPYAPGLQKQGLDLSRLVLLPKQATDDAAWACEQLLQSQSCGLVLAWLDLRKPQIIRRLQLLAKAANSLLFLCRPLTALQQSSVAQARIEIEAINGGAKLYIHKVQGDLRRPELSLSWASAETVDGP